VQQHGRAEIFAYARFRAPLLCGFVVGQRREAQWQRVAIEGTRHICCLLDDVDPGAGDALLKKQPSGALTGIVFAKQPCGARPARQHGRAERTLQIERGVVTDIAQLAAVLQDARKRGRSQGVLCPGFGRDAVEAVYQRLRQGAGGMVVSRIGCEECAPLRLAGPAEVDLRVRGAQRRHCWERMKDVSHGAEADDQYALLFAL
jgi:hypothetical protein